MMTWDSSNVYVSEIKLHTHASNLLTDIDSQPDAKLPCLNHPVVAFLFLRVVDFVVLYKKDSAWLSGAP